MAATALLAPPTLLAPSAAAAAPVARAHSSSGGGYDHRAPLVVGHRGASGHRPEHTLGSYLTAIRGGADFIEPDLVPTKDGVLVTRHENDITETTDVADHPEFAHLRTTKVVDGISHTGWFTEDFTYHQLRQLRAKERLPDVRPGNTAYDGRFRIPTFEMVLDLARREGLRRGRPVGVYPETKHPTYFRSIGLPIEPRLVRALRRHHLDRPGAKVFIQSFEVGNLRRLSRVVRVPLVQLVDAVGAPYDLVAAGSSTTYADMVTPRGLTRMARYADVVGANKDLVLPRNDAGATTHPSDLVDDAHARGLDVHIWTMRNENQFMATNFQRGDDPDAFGRVRAEYLAFFEAGVDGVFSDYPDRAVAARKAWVRNQVLRAS